METTVDMSRIIPFPKVDRKVRSEASLKRRDKLTGIPGALGVMLGVSWMLFWMLWLFSVAMSESLATSATLWEETWLPNALFAVILVLFGVWMITINHYVESDLKYYYQDVLQGQVMATHSATSDGQAQLAVTLEGYNRMGQITRQRRALDEQVWKQTSKGDVIDLRK
ncbi:MAG: hypothetical protein WAQ27_02710 [Candidatus Microsaccharimonas sp.]